MSMENTLMKMKEPKGETEEEKEIKQLVDDIYEYEEKISEINSYLEKIPSTDSDENIVSLKKKENSFKDKLNLIKIKINDEISKKQNIADTNVYMLISNSSYEEFKKRFFILRLCLFPKVI